MQISRKGDTVYFDVKSDIYFVNAQEIRQIILDNIKETDKTAVVNLSKVEFMDSSGLSIFITLLKRVKEKDGKLILEYPQLGVLKFLEMTQLDKLMEIRKADEPKTGSWPEAKGGWPDIENK
ncbi:MAG TPA: STAS domain-containing protein [Clostridiales bacterium]|jgi:anti-sigma B factor antagonist|nr:STAS domain-containing protein [Clostridiales bacterium]